MCSIVECEETQWILGARGTCNNNTGLCECPEGFNGLDDWASFNSCNVNIELNFRLKIAMLIINGLDVFVALLCTMYLLCRWGFTPTVQLRRYSSSGLVPSRRVSKTPAGVDVSTPKLSLLRPPTEEKPGVAKSKRKIWRRKRDSIVGFVFFVVFAVTGLGYNVPFLIIDDAHPNGVRRPDIAEGNPWAYVSTIFLALAVGFLFAAFNSLLVTWYNTLPSVRRYGALLGMNSLFVRYPGMIYRVSRYSMIWVFIFTVPLLAIVPMVDTSYQPTSDLIWKVMVIVSLNIYYISIFAVAKTLMKIFKDTIVAIGPSGEMKKGGSVVKKALLQESINTCRLLLAGTTVGYTIAMVCLVCMLIFERTIWIFFNVVIIVAHSTSMFLIVLMTFRTSGGGAPRERRSSRSSKSSKFSKDDTATDERRVAKGQDEEKQDDEDVSQLDQTL